MVLYVETHKALYRNGSVSKTYAKRKEAKRKSTYASVSASLIVVWMTGLEPATS